MRWFGPDFFSLLSQELAPLAARHGLRQVGRQRVRYMNTVVYANERRVLEFTLDHVDLWLDVVYGSVSVLETDSPVSPSPTEPLRSLLHLLRQDRPWFPWFEGGALQHGYDPDHLVREIVAGLERHEREVFRPLD